MGDVGVWTSAASYLFRQSGCDRSRNGAYGDHFASLRDLWYDGCSGRRAARYGLFGRTHVPFFDRGLRTASDLDRDSVSDPAVSQDFHSVSVLSDHLDDHAVGAAMSLHVCTDKNEERKLTAVKVRCSCEAVIYAQHR